MRYFIMSQDKRIQNRMILREFPTSASVDYDTSYASRLSEHTSLFTAEKDTSAYPQVLEAPIYMVSKMIHDVLVMYDESVIYKSVSIINQKRNTLHAYYLALIDRIECLHESSEFYPDHSVKKLVLDSHKMNNAQIFRVKDISSPVVIVSLDIVESILRRDYFGVVFSEVECV